MKKSPLANWLDGLLLRLALPTLGVLWFLYLWGVCWGALTAGVALGGLMLACTRQYRKMRVRTREAQMRRQIGGRLALDALLLTPPHRAGFQAAMWVAPKYPCEFLRTTRAGVLCEAQGERTLITLVNRHESEQVTVTDMVQARRETLAARASHGMLCLTAPATRAALAYADTGTPRLTLILREELIDLAGLASPATDEQLASLSPRRRPRAGWKRWLRHVLSPRRSMRYLLCGLGLAGMYLLTGLMYYPIPAVLCLLLCVASRLYGERHGIV